jgi:hypothetical protein
MAVCLLFCFEMCEKGLENGAFAAWFHYTQNGERTQEMRRTRFAELRCGKAIFVTVFFQMMARFMI